MPLYAFVCESCGPFDEFRPVEDAAEPMACPSCAGPATRVLTTPAALRPAAIRSAEARNEKSAHEPAVRSGREQPPQDAPAPPPKPHHSHGRPWQIGH